MKIPAGAGIFVHHQAGKEGQLSNQFVPDLDAITDFLDRYRVEIEMILKEVDQAENLAPEKAKVAK